MARRRAHRDVPEDDLIPPNPIIVVTHAAFSERRHIAMQGLLSDLRLQAPDIPVRLIDDWHRQGSLWCWRQAMEEGLASGHSHIVWLPDDALVCKDFGRLLRACINARPDDVFDCYVNKDIDGAIGNHLWYTTLDGYTGMAGVMPRQALLDHLAWRDSHPELHEYPNDAGVALWAMATRRPILKTSYSLVTHDHLIPSLDGHDGQERDGIERKGKRPIDLARAGVSEDVMNLLGRTYMAPEEHLPGYRSRAIDLGKTYASSHHHLVTKLRPPDVKGYFWAQRDAMPVSKEPLVFVAMPNQGSIKAAVSQAIVTESNHLLQNNIGVLLNLKVHDSLITRARDRLVASFMASTATHLLFWDSDIVPTQVGFIKALLGAKLPLVAGAAPFKNDTGHVVCVLDEAFKNAKQQYDMPVVNGCVEVKCAGTGIMLISREVIGRLCEAHPELMYVCHVPGVVNRVEWALFQDKVRDYDRLSEDWEFCQRWRDLGEHVYVHPDLEFTHIGERAYEGSFHGQWAG